MIESGYIIEYCGTPYVHGLLVVCLCLICAWIPSVCRSGYRLFSNISRLLWRVFRRWF